MMFNTHTHTIIYETLDLNSNIMNTAIQNSNNRKPLSVDFDLHTDGDQEFKSELISLMIDNVRELQDSLVQAYKMNKPELFREASHKVKPTISILNDQELMDTIESLKLHVHDHKEPIISLFNMLCENIIKALEEEIK
jgi:hypothetical protein